MRWSGGWRGTRDEAGSLSMRTIELERWKVRDIVRKHHVKVVSKHEDGIPNKVTLLINDFVEELLDTVNGPRGSHRKHLERMEPDEIRAYLYWRL